MSSFVLLRQCVLGPIKMARWMSKIWLLRLRMSEEKKEWQCLEVSQGGLTACPFPLSFVR